MTRPMRTSRQGLDLIKSFEGFRARSTPLGGGRWVIGYGHTRTARKGLEISEADAARILQHYDLPPIEEALQRLILAPIHQNQFDALVSFAFNLGIETFRGCDVLAHFNAGEPLRAAIAMGAWRKADINGHFITVDALVRRRAMERALFLESPRGRPVAPSPIIVPRRDTGGDEPELRDTPRRIDTSGDTPRIIDPVPEPARTPPPPPAAPPPASPERTSEETARRIGERVTRILNESPGVPPDRALGRPSPSAPPGSVAPARSDRPAAGPPSADDITAAIAAIASPPPQGDPDDREDDDNDRDNGHDSGTADRLPPPPEPGRAAPRGRTGIVIDDLEPVDLDTLDGLDSPAIDWTTLAAFAFAALLGGLTAAWGLGQVARVASGQAAFTDQWQMLIGPFAVVLGTVLAALMAYAALRSLLRR